MPEMEIVVELDAERDNTVYDTVYTGGPPNPAAPAVHYDDHVYSDEFVKNVEKTATQWCTDGSGNVFWASGPVQPLIPPGLYRVQVSDRLGTHFIKQIISTDKLIELDDSESLQIIAEIEKFWLPETKQAFLKRGMIHKRGILMSGDPGSGKTSTIQLLVSRLVLAGGIAIYPHQHPKITAEGLQLVRRIEPERPIIMILEDFETLIQRDDNENEWLAILDGESQVGNIVFLATTNYVERLDKRFVDRPSRFDSIRDVGMPSKKIRAQYLKEREPDMTEKEVNDFLEVSDGLSIAHLKEIILSVRVFGYSLDDTKKRMDKMRERDMTSDRNLEGTKHGKIAVGIQGSRR